MTQYARPSSDVSATNWTGTYDYINEVSPSDIDYIVGSNSANGTFICGLNSINEPATKTACTIKFRARKSAAAGNARQVSVQVFEGTTARGSAVASGDLTETWTEYTSSSIDLSAVTNWSALRFNIVSAGTVSPPTGDKREVWVSWGVLETPDTSGTPTSTSKPAFIQGQVNATPSSKAAFVAGQTTATPSSKSAYLAGGIELTGSLADIITSHTPDIYWKFNETSGTTAEDSTANNYDGTYSGVTLAAINAPGGGKAPYFPNTAYVTRTHNINSTTSGTFVMFVKLYDASDWETTNKELLRIIGTGYQMLGTFTTGEVFSNSAGYYSVYDTDKPTVWFMLASVWSVSGNTRRIYFNGLPGSADTNREWLGTQLTINGAANRARAYHSNFAYFPSILSQVDLIQIAAAGQRSVPAFLQGTASDLSSKVAYLEGAAGGSSTSSSKVAYLAGTANATPSSKSAYLVGQGNETSGKPAFLQGTADATPSSKAAYLSGVNGANSFKIAYLEGYSAETTVGPNYPNTNTFDEAVAPYDDIGWTNHDNVISDNSVYATITSPSFDTGIISWRINANEFGFSIPSNAVILGIKVEVERRYATATVKDALVALRNPITATTSDNKADTVNNWPNVDTMKSYGGTADLWGIAWSPDAINSASFAVYFACVATGDNADAYVDYIRVSVTYKEGTNTSSSKVAYLSANANATPSSQAAYILGGVEVNSNKAAYLTGQGTGTDVSSSKPAYLSVQGTTTTSKAAFLAGSTSATPSSKAAYLAGANGLTDSTPAYINGAAAEDEAYDNQAAYLKGQSSYTTSKVAYLKGSATTTTSKVAYLFGILGSNSHKAAYLYGYMVGGVGKLFGYNVPAEGETAVSWQTFSDGAGGDPTITGDVDWGKISLAATGEEARSEVYDTSSTEYRTITMTANRYGYGQGTITLQIRGSATTFTQDASAPVWETYTLPVIRNWRYVQVRTTNK